MTMITKSQAEALIALAIELRPATATQWNHAGTRAAIANQRNDREALDVIRALTVLAADPTVRTPAVLAVDGPHWPAKTRPTPTPPAFIRQPKPQTTVDGPALARRALTNARPSPSHLFGKGDLW